ncbi:MAG: glycosyltransferase family 2 protein, partial [Nanoarchaeota archaeon]
NFLVKNSDSEYFVLLNNDTEVGKHWLDEMLKTMSRHKNCVACQPKIKNYYKRSEFEYAGAAGGFVDVYGFPFCRGRIFNIIEKDLGQYNNEAKIFWGCGVCLMVKRDFFVGSGMFDEDLHMYAEELDFCWRANIYGKEIWFTPNSEIYHIGSFSVDSKKINFIKDYWITRNHIIVPIKNYSFFRLLKILPIKILLEIISAMRFPNIKAVPFVKSMFSIPLLYIRKIHKKRREIQNNRRIEEKELEEIMNKRSIALEHFLEGKNKFNQIKIG